MDLLALVDCVKSQSFAIRSHSVPGSISSTSATHSFSAFLEGQVFGEFSLKNWKKLF
jgi:hypothetical protein